jgi:hypothetical protein
MGKKKTRGGGPPQKRESSIVIIIAVLAILFSVGLTVKTAFFSSNNTAPVRTAEVNIDPSRFQTTPAAVNDPIETKVYRVASHFRCACGGCGELPLAECECDMPRGSVEEKNFIRNNLKKGLSVEQVVAMVEKTYGHRN